MARHGAHTKRGSALVTSMLLLMFILITGAVLVNWGLYNVQLTVNVRTQQQAYYSAKSVLDATVKALENDAQACTALDKNALRGMAPRTSTAASEVNAGAVPGNIALSIAYDSVPQDVGGGVITQDYIVTARAEYIDAMKNSQTAAVSRRITITRTPAGSISGFVGGAAENARDKSKYTLENIVVMGDVNIRRAKSIMLSKHCVLSQNVLLSADGIELVPVGNQSFQIGFDAGSGNAGGVALYGESSVTMNQGNRPIDIQFGNVQLYTPQLNDNKGLIKKSAASFEKYPYDAGQPEPLSYRLREWTMPEKTENGSGKTQITVDESAVLEECDLTGVSLTVNTNGGVIDLVLSGSTVGFDRPVTVTGGGTVNFRCNGAGSLVSITDGFRVNREGGDGAVVNFIVDGTDAMLEVRGVADEKINLIVPRGEIWMTTAHITGTVLCDGLTNFGGSGSSFDTTRTEPWTGDTGSAVEVTSGGGGAGEIRCAAKAGAYVK